MSRFLRRACLMSMALALLATAPVLAQRPQKPDFSTASTAKDQGVTNPLHGQNVGRIVFTRSDLTLKDIKAADFLTATDLSQSIFFRVYMEKSAVNVLAPQAGGMSASNVGLQTVYRMSFRVDGAAPITVTFDRWGMPNEHMTWTTWRGVLLNRGDSTKIPGADVFREFLARATSAGQLKPGAHAVEMEIAPLVRGQATVDGPVVARGSLTLQVKPTDFRKDDAAVCIPHKAAMTDPATARTILQTAQRTWSQPGTKPEKVILTNDGWRIYRHEISGVVTRRTIDAVIAARGPAFCSYQGYAFSQEFVGGKFDPAGTFSGSEEREHFIPCSCLE
jgi:hypothetical protein